MIPEGEGSRLLRNANEKVADKVGIDLDKLPKKTLDAWEDMSWPTNRLHEKEDDG